MIEIKDLSKTFSSASGTVEALRDINLTINDGEIFGIIGLSGAGKSSALRAIRSLGGEVIDCDALYHEMLETCAPLRDEIEKAEGREVA
mgnify:CR=1 FL=1